MKRKHSLLLLASIIATVLFSVGCDSDDETNAVSADTVIDIAAIPGVTPPALGQVPVTMITETDQYTGTVSWSPADNPFGSETVYTATITLTAKSGYTLTGVPANFFTVAGADAVTHDANSGVVTAVFPETGSTPPEVIDIAAIPGVTAPAGGETPVTAITETAQYTGTVSWSPTDSPFAYETVYTATITLTAKSGYTLIGVSANFFTIAGADTVTHDADSGVITAVFPATATAPEVIDIAAIPDITAPAQGQTPVTTTETAQYTGTVSWSPADDPFDYETTYTATITLTAKSGYTLTGVPANFFTVAGADTVTNDADSGVVIADFPATEVQYLIGDTGPGGGLVFYDKGYYSEGWRYLEAAPQSTEWSSNVWGGYGTEVTGADGTAIGTGMQNTIDIVTQFGESEPLEDKTDYAAKVCNDLVSGGYDDWFLPSKAELKKMYQNLKAQGLGGFTDGYYWSSSEDTINYGWYTYFTDGFQWGSNKLIENSVRAARAF